MRLTYELHMRSWFTSLHLRFLISPLQIWNIFKEEFVERECGGKKKKKQPKQKKSLQIGVCIWGWKQCIQLKMERHQMRGWSTLTTSPTKGQWSQWPMLSSHFKRVPYWHQAAQCGREPCTWVQAQIGRLEALSPWVWLDLTTFNLWTKGISWVTDFQILFQWPLVIFYCVFVFV